MKQIIAAIFSVIPFVLFAQRNVNTVDTLPVKIFIDNNVLGKSIDGFVVMKGCKRHLLNTDKMRIKKQNLPYAINCQKCPVDFSFLGEKTVRFVAGNGVSIVQKSEQDGSSTITISVIKQ